jgi:hypothetical protein
VSSPIRITDDLDHLEGQIRRLHIEWDKFFGGVERKPPTELRTKVEALIRKHAAGEIRNNGERFRYQTLTARYNTFNELWSKKLRAMEEGRPVGLHGRAAAIAAAAVEAAAAASAGAPPRTAHQPVPPSSSSEYRVRNAAVDGDTVRALFEEFLETRLKTGETAPVKFDSFQKIIAQQAARILTEKGAQAVDFRLETKDGKVSLKAKPVR